jgi:S1-C subfamily serine protease
MKGGATALAASALAVVLALVTSAQALRADPAVDRAVRSTVLLMTSGCAGTFVSETDILTAAHCVFGQSLDSPQTVSGYTFPEADVVRRDDRDDLALLRLKSGSASQGGAAVASFSAAEPALRDEVFSVGHPAGRQWVVLTGRIAKSVTEDFGYCNMPQVGYAAHEVWLMDMRGYPGDSGAGLFSARGELVGVWVGGELDGDCSHPGRMILWGLANSWSVVRAFLESR